MIRPVEQRFVPGQPVVITSDSQIERYSTVFEDDGETGYFYAYDRRSSSTNPILDALHIYDVSSVIDRHVDSSVQILWSEDGLKSVLLINGYPHAVFDFDAKRGYCRSGSLNLPLAVTSGWSGNTHTWNDAALKFFRPSEE